MGRVALHARRSLLPRHPDHAEVSSRPLRRPPRPLRHSTHRIAQSVQNVLLAVGSNLTQKGSQHARAHRWSCVSNRLTRKDQGSTTVMVPIIGGWGVQWYPYSPASVKV